MLAHYMNDKDYIDEIINGDIHTTNQQLAGLESRDQAKTFIYAFLYGAGDEKLGSVAGGGRSVGSELKQSFLDNLPSLRTLKNSVTRKAAKSKFLKALDGRKLFIRSEHSALNMLLQGAGAIVMKKALVIFNNKLQGMDANFVVNVHDEFQVEVREDLAETVGNLGVESIIEAGKVLKLNCPLDGEYRIGDNWSETH
jgi:DNA polymerase I-like protein with 3'-5' exonuclease and polymerase domains